MNVKPACGLSDFTQPVFVQLGFHNLAGWIFHEGRLPVVARYGNKRALRCSDAHREDSHTGVSRCGFCCVHSVTTQFLAVGKDDERSISGGAFAEALRGQSDGAGNVRSAFGNRLRV